MALTLICQEAAVIQEPRREEHTLNTVLQRAGLDSRKNLWGPRSHRE